MLLRALGKIEEHLLVVTQDGILLKVWLFAQKPVYQLTGMRPPINNIAHCDNTSIP